MTDSKVWFSVVKRPSLPGIGFTFADSPVELPEVELPEVELSEVVPLPESPKVPPLSVIPLFVEVSSVAAAPVCMLPLWECTSSSRPDDEEINGSVVEAAGTFVDVVPAAPEEPVASAASVAEPFPSSGEKHPVSTAPISTVRARFAEIIQLLYHRSGPRCKVWITAWNPRGKNNGWNGRHLHRSTICSS